MSFNSLGAVDNLKRLEGDILMAEDETRGAWRAVSTAMQRATQYSAIRISQNERSKLSTAPIKNAVIAVDFIFILVPLWINCESESVKKMALLF